MLLSLFSHLNPEKAEDAALVKEIAGGSRLR
jgi:hypothetical protein